MMCLWRFRYESNSTGKMMIQFNDSFFYSKADASSLVQYKNHGCWILGIKIGNVSY